LPLLGFNTVASHRHWHYFPGKTSISTVYFLLFCTHECVHMLLVNLSIKSSKLCLVFLYFPYSMPTISSLRGQQTHIPFSSSFSPGTMTLYLNVSAQPGFADIHPSACLGITLFYVKIIKTSYI
jgi:hypothetical protein